VEHAQHLPRSFPWRAAAVVAAAIAVVELVALIAVGALHVARPFAHPATAGHAATRHIAATRRPIAHVPSVALPPAHRLLARAAVAVLVLNGNGVAGAAHGEAVRLEGLGYRIGGAENALRHDYARSMVMYVPGYVHEARRLAHDAGIGIVAPVDGLTPARLKASRLVLLLGN